MGLRLIGRTGDHRGTAINVDAERFVLGRDDDADLTLVDLKVSRRHAAIERLASGEMMLTDLGSANGTFLDERRISSPIVLKGGEVLRIGDTSYLVEIGGSGTVVETRPQGARAPKLAFSRRTAIIAGAVVAAVVVAVGAFLVLGSGGDDSLSTQEIVEARRSSTLPVTASLDNRVVGGGTGWVLDAEEGLIVTNAHVVNPGETFTVGLGAGQRAARVVAVAPCEDLALLRANDANGFTVQPLGSGDELAQGDDVVALGFPTNASNLDELTVTRGVISALDTTINDPPPSIPQLPNLIRTDAAINPGNSGGPLVDDRGRLVGVNTLGNSSNDQEGYAISVDRVQEVLGTLRQGNSLAWTGVGFYELGSGRYGNGFEEEATAFAEYFGVDPTAGLIFDHAVPDTSAARLADDGPFLLTAVEGRQVTTMDEYCRAVQGFQTGDSAGFSLNAQASEGSPRSATIPLTFE